MAYTAVCHGSVTTDFAARFVATWHEFSPGIETDLLVICNGGCLTVEQALLFAPLHARMLPRSNEGFDIGGYREASIGPLSEYDLVLFCGESVYFHREGWLRRIAEAWSKHGPGMYGSFSSNLVRSHLNTTGFCCPPSELVKYRDPITDRPSRYALEHGERALWRRIRRNGMPVKLVTWDGEYDPPQWRLPPNILWRGDQSNCLMRCSHTDRYSKANPETQRRWARGADRPYK